MFKYLCSIGIITFCVLSHAISPKQAATPIATPKPASTAGYEAEARLISIYKLISDGQARAALPLAERLTKDFPTFQLGHLVYGDLLNLKKQAIKTLGDLPSDMHRPAQLAALADLREESSQRLKALQDPPPYGYIPSQLLQLSARNQHVIAVDASKSRLYVLKNDVDGIKIIQNYYVSIGKAGTGKQAQGDFKTPLGVYYLTTPINPKLLAPLYGGGALPINYPNPLDQRLGKSGSGIWLHGTMPERYSRQVKSTDGCIVMANPDMYQLMKTVAVKTTPVIIANKLQWVKPEQLASERQQFEASLAAWRTAKNTAQSERLRSFYLSDFTDYKHTLDTWWPTVIQEMAQAKNRPIKWGEVTTLIWRPEAGGKNPAVMVVTYDEIQPGTKRPVTKRQYWLQLNNQWKVFFEGIIASS
ncbi:MAG: L,D-transpeptidase family protein [Cytophagales bacterium]|nr:L,D-transpeptidase family protein [Cytophagales bacterium]